MSDMPKSGLTKSVRRALVLGLLAAPLVAATLLAPHAEAATSTPAASGRPIAVLAAQTSSNWGGYNQGILEAGKSGGFHQVSAQWVVPTATQRQAGRAEYSSTWVGIGGGCMETSCLVTDSTLIQAGSEQDVAANGAASYSVWYELIPGPGLTITNLSVHAGDTVSVDIRELVANSNVWTITVKVNGTPFTTTLPYTSTHGTVEWIVETPIVIGGDGTGLAAMPNLAKTTFANVKANNAGPGLTEPEKINLEDLDGKRIATPSAASTTGFSVCTYTTSCS
jgi:hypothetical protein